MSTIEERVAALESALASMTAAEKRIVELPAASSVANDDFVALDGVVNGSRRFAASNLGGKAEVMTEAEWDDLPSSKLTDGKVYALSGVSPSTQDNPLWQKLGFASLDTQADDCSDAINELNTGLTTLNSNKTNYPDYTNVITLHTGNNTVADIVYEGVIANDGYLQTLVNIGNTNGSPFTRIIINGTTVFNFNHKYTNNYIYAESPLFPVKSGDTYKIQVGTGGVATGANMVYLYPNR